MVVSIIEGICCQRFHCIIYIMYSIISRASAHGTPGKLNTNVPDRGIASRKQVRGPQHNMLTIANVNQDIESILK